jgi:hypothetical protein
MWLSRVFPEYVLAVGLLGFGSVADQHFPGAIQTVGSLSHPAASSGIGNQQLFVGSGVVEAGAKRRGGPVEILRWFHLFSNTMRLRTVVSFFILFLIKLGSDAAFAQGGTGALQSSNNADSNLTWKATLMTGDNQIDAFDNARKALKSEFIQMGVTPGNIKELSMNPAERIHGSLRSSVRNFAGALRDLSIGDHDACLIHLTSHGSPQGFYLRNAPALTPQTLSTILDASCGDRPTVVLVSACYSGVFVGNTMLKPNRIILTAARQDRTSFGCSTENEYTYWDGCLIDSLPKADTWKSLYGAIQQCVQRKESNGRFQPSLPQAYFGAQVSDLKIPSTLSGNLLSTTKQFPEGNNDSYGFGATNAVKAGTVEPSGSGPKGNR